MVYSSDFGDTLNNPVHNIETADTLNPNSRKESPKNLIIHSDLSNGKTEKPFFCNTIAQLKCEVMAGQLKVVRWCRIFLKKEDFMDIRKRMEETPFSFPHLSQANRPLVKESLLNNSLTYSCFLKSVILTIAFLITLPQAVYDFFCFVLK